MALSTLPKPPWPREPEVTDKGSSKHGPGLFPICSTLAITSVSSHTELATWCALFAQRSTPATDKKMKQHHDRTWLLPARLPGPKHLAFFGAGG